VPLNLTVFADGVALNPCPWSVTCVPTGPREGVKLRAPAPVMVDRIDFQNFPYQRIDVLPRHASRVNSPYEATQVS